MTEHGRNPILLARYLALAWLGLIVYGSLHPFSGWRDTGVSPFVFLGAAWPRYWTAFDLLANVAVYLPLGFFMALAFSRLPWRYTAPILAALLCAAISFGLETTQTWLPSRVPSNLDFVCNAIGGLLGAVLALVTGPRIFVRLAALQQRLVAPIPHAEMGLTLLGLWLLVPLSPETLLFGAGDFRHWFDWPGVLPFDAERFVVIEASVAALNALAIGLIVRLLCARLFAACLIAPLFLVLGLTVRTLAAAILIGPGEALAWLTAGARYGLIASALLLCLTIWLPARPRLILILLALAAGTLLVNLAPPNPYSITALATWRQGHFLNFNGLTRVAATLWPFLVLPFLLLAARRPPIMGNSPRSPFMSYYTHHVFICCNQREDSEPCCNVIGGAEAFAYAKDRIGALKKNGRGAIRINKAGCLGRCDSGPVMVVYPEETWYSFIDHDDVEEIIQEHLLNGRIVERLKI